MTTRIEQDLDVQASRVYDDTLPAGSTLETNATELQADLNAIRSQLLRLSQALDPSIVSWVESPQGGAGLVSIETDDALAPGQVVYVKGTGRLGLSSSPSAPFSGSSGMSLTTTAPTFAATVATDGVVTLADWTAVIGAVSLVPGAVYYLSATGGAMTTTAPSTGHLVRLGRALSVTQFGLAIARLVRRT
jgi:hypothetical protein